MPAANVFIPPQDAAGLGAGDDLLILDLCKAGPGGRPQLPGAVHVHPGELVSGAEPAPGKLPSGERLSRLLSRIGFTGQRLLIYDDEGGGWAGRFAWTLHLLGHDDWQVLDGGLTAWLGLEQEWTARATEPQPSDFKAEPVGERLAAGRAQLEDVLQALDGDTVIWDARSPEEYRGERRTAQRRGHIPGAVNLQWTDLMDSTRHLQLRRDARELLQQAGLTGERPIITYCQTHHRSAFTWLVGHSLGFAISGYDGSWSEWGNRADTPVATG